MAAPEPGSPVPPHGIDFINKNYAGGVFFPLYEQVSDPGRAHAHKHFNEIRSADAEKGDAGFTGNGPSQQRLSRSRSPDHQHPLGYPAAQAGIFFRIF